METHEDGPSNTRVIATGGAAAGLIAAAVITFGRRRPAEPGLRVERTGDASVRIQVNAAPLRDATVAATAAATQPAADVAKRAERASKKAVKAARNASADIANSAKETPAAAAKTARGGVAAGRRSGRDARRWGGAAFDRSRDRVEHVAESLATQSASRAMSGFDRLRRGPRTATERRKQGGHDVKDQAMERAQRVGAQTTSTAQSVATQAAAAAIAGAERARGAGASLVDAARERAPQVGQRVSDELVPSLRDLATQAASAALELWEAARERAVDAAESAQHDFAPHAAHAFEAGAGRVKEAGVAVGGRVGEVGERTKDASRKAAGATVDTGKDTGATLMWAGAAAGLVFYALLDDERREQVTRTVQSVAGQVQELIRDFQGYDDEF